MEREKTAKLCFQGILMQGCCDPILFHAHPHGPFLLLSAEISIYLFLYLI